MLAAVALGWKFVSDLVTEYLWFRSLGYESVLLIRLRAQLGIAAAAAAVAFAFVAVNLLLTRKARSRISTAWILLLSFAAALAAAAWAWPQWMEVQQWVHATAFGANVPVFNADVSFFVFTLPVIKLALSLVWALAVSTTAAVILIYLASGALTSTLGYSSLFEDAQPFDPYLQANPRADRPARSRLSRFAGALVRLFLRPAPPLQTDGWAKLHVCLAVAFLMLLVAVGQLVGAWQLAYSQRGVVAGPSYADIHGALPALRVMAALWTAGALAVAWSGVTRRQIRTAAVALLIPALLIALSVLAVNVYPDLVQRICVTPNELAAERQQILNNIEMTRKAFGLEGIEQREYKVAESVTRASLENAGSTLNNVRLWDWDPLLRSFQQLQEIRLYYRFHDIDIDRYLIDGQQTQVMLSARELDMNRLPAQAQTWVNRRLKYTHGYGVCASPVNVIGQDGLPSFLVRDIPPQAPSSMALTRPQIYFGELTTDWVVVNTRTDEFDYPVGESNQHTRYDAESGVRVGGLLTRAMLATKFGDIRLLLSRDVTGESRILFDRDIVSRVRKIAPFLDYDGDPYVVIADERLVWMINAITSTSMYPMAQPFNRRTNYVRNSVKITVDAYTGEVSFYIVDGNDPLAATYAKVFPGLFKREDEMPDSIRQHLRYPEDLFIMQAKMYATYHVSDPEVFYNNEDVWDIPRLAYSATPGVEVSPYYVNMVLPGEEELSFVLFTPYTPARKDNMVAWLAVSSEEEDHGRMVAFNFGKQSMVFGPAQIEAQIDQDAEISSLLSLWNQSGSRVVRGNLLVYLIDGGILYVEPLFLAAHASQLPQLKRVVVSDGTRVEIGENLEQALDALVGPAHTDVGYTPAGPTYARPTYTGPTSAPMPGELGAAAPDAARALATFRQAQEALRAGDFAEYGRLLEELEAILIRLSAERCEGEGGGGVQ